MNDEYNLLKKQYVNIIDEIDDEIENVKYLFDHVEIDDINLYSIYLKLNDLIYQKKLIKSKIKNYQIENNIVDDELFID